MAVLRRDCGVGIKKMSVLLVNSVVLVNDRNCVHFGVRVIILYSILLKKLIGLN